MRLNKEGKIELRERVNEKLKDIEPSKRIVLPMNILDDLLFDYSKTKDGVEFKKIGFITDNLSKLDLSKVSFKNVSFHSPYIRVDLSNTNVKIDFTETYHYIRSNGVVLTNINLKNVDLSNNDFTKLTEEYSALIRDCDLSNTGIVFNGDQNLEIRQSNLSFNHFENLELVIGENSSPSSYILLTTIDEVTRILDCNLANTHANIIKINKLKDDCKKGLSKMISDGYLDNCFLNGKIITSLEYKLKEREVLKDKYEKFKIERINGTLDLIDRQLSHDGGRVVSKTLKPYTEPDATGMID